jgi:putative hydrolase of the HAD superfamily
MIRVGVTLDVGQTLLELDAVMLARRLDERGHRVSLESVEAALGPGFRTYDEEVRAGASGHPWKALMRALLAAAGVDLAATGDLADWLFEEQLTQNLWRRPVRGMIELVRDLRALGVPVAVLSNSEGRLAELLEQLGHLNLFDAVVDSGRLGLEKPDPRVFAWTAGRLGLPMDRVIHVGDSRSADVDGALNSGLRAVWFRGASDAPYRIVPETSFDARRARVAFDATEVRSALADFGVPLL